MKDLITFTGGLDFDSDIRNVGEVDYIDALNISSGTSQRGSIHNMYGNKLQNYTLPAGENTCIGTLRNIKQNTIIYFLYNSIGNHSILEYFCETKTIQPILVPFTLGSLVFDTSFLGFTKEYKIHSANIIDDILTWTDNNVSPRKINKKRAYDFIQQLPPSATNIPYDNLIATGTEAQKVQFIEFIKYKPDMPPSIASAYDSTRKTSYIREKMIQAKYRYIYDDNEYSRWSTASVVSYPAKESAFGQLPVSISDNYVTIGYNTGHPTVKAIEIAVRFDNIGIWSKIDPPVAKYSQSNQRILNDYTDLTVDFYNDTVLIEFAEDFNNYDSVPQIAKTQEIIDGNRQVFANNVEGYQNPTISVVTSIVTENIDLGPDSVAIGYVVPSTAPFPFYYDINPDQFNLFVPIVKPSYLVVGSSIRFKLRVYDTITGVEKFYDISYAVTYEDLNSYPSLLTEHLMDTIAGTTGLTPFSFGFYNTNYWFISIGSAGDSVYIDVNLAQIIPTLVKVPSFKKGANHAFGILYRDAQGRDGGVVSSENMAVYNPYLPETNPSATVNTNLAYKSDVQVAVSHIPPIWASTYEIVYGLSDMQKYTQFIIKGQAVGNAQGNYDINCSYIIDYITKDRVTPSVDFQFEVGDNLRFISNSQKIVPQYTDVKVLAFDPTTNILTVGGFSRSILQTGMTVGSDEGMLVELYSIKQRTDKNSRAYFSFRKVYDIINQGQTNRSHGGDVNQNIIAGTPAYVTLTRGDCYIYKRLFSNNTKTTVVESENYSDFYASKNIDISSIYGVIPNGKTTRYEQSLRYGGRYFPNTNANDLCQFNGSDYDTVNTRYGPINKIATVGYTLKVLQTKKNTSIYIDRNMIFNANGDSQLTLTDKVLGNKNPSELDYGCDHPESVCVDDRHMYFFDVNTGAFIQDAPNGMMPISDYKAKTYFRNISQKIKDTSNIYVYCSMDIFNAYINVTFIDTTGNIIPNQTIVYHTPDNKWKTKLSYTPEYYGSNALTFVSFKDGALWEHNDQTVARNNFYGIQYSTKVKFVANTDYLTIKNFASVAIYSNKLWSSPDIGDITIPASTGYPIGMESRLLPAKFRWKESVAYADYLRDANTPNFPTQEAALMGGRKLRGQVLVQEIENSDIDETVLYSVLITSVPSPLSK
jgi:hypothetical protein